ncbi:K02A2.6-like [Cordylochernes scorpioides]|uniref:K02A2.6-like n=1 Tax=Cordylochernes scorpioides TaxID=51811 RepID=A0ABY6LJD3_9ARAC|nr:K02A2.6-like [Cordylochernes scorpioides]
METAREKVRQTYLKGQDEAGAKFAESKLRVFPEGQLVLVERMHETKGRHKLEPRYEGPFLVLERTGETVYLLEDTKSGKRDKFHVDRMKAYYEPIRTYPLNSTNNQEQESEEDEEFCSTNPGFLGDIKFTPESHNNSREGCTAEVGVMFGGELFVLLVTSKVEYTGAIV